MPSLTLTALEGMPEVVAGDDLARLVREALARSSIQPADGDVLVVAQKVVSKSEGRRVALSSVEPSARARELAAVTRKDPRLIELVLRESVEVLRAKRDVIVVEHRRGWIMANAGIDMSNVDAGGEHALLLPEDPDASCRGLRAALADIADFGVIVNASVGRAWRTGVTGTASARSWKTSRPTSASPSAMSRKTIGLPSYSGRDAISATSAACSARM